MKNNFLIKFICCLLLLGCFYQFILTVPIQLAEQKAEVAAGFYAAHYPDDVKDSIKTVALQQELDKISDKILFEIPYIKKYTYHDLKEQQIKLGLDLKGGMMVTLGFEDNPSLEQMEETRFLLSQRMNSMGLSQTQVTLDKDKERIYIEMPDVQNPERMRKLITEQASLEFWNTYRVTDAGILEGLIEADKRLSRME